MKNLIIITLLCSLSLYCASEALAQQQPVTAEARLLYTGGSHDDVLVMGYRAGVVTYRSSAKSLNILQAKKPKLESVYFYEPKVFTEAMRFYRAKNYAEAKVRFAECETMYKAVDSLPDNYASLGGFYKMECSRKLNDLEALSAELEKYRKDGLTRDFHFQQLEIYTFWEAVRLKEWGRLDRLALSWRDRKVPSELRVQIEYCHALALEELSKEDPSRFQELIDAFNRVLSADATASIDLVLKAANSLLRIYAADAEVKYVMENWDPNPDRTPLAGDQKLMEAVSLVRFYKEVGFNGIQPLPAEYEKFLEYAPEVEAPAAVAKPEEEAAVGEEEATEAEKETAEAEEEATETEEEQE